MKTKTTRTEIYKEFGKNRTFYFGYCVIQHLESALQERPYMYTAGVYGWNADIYPFRFFAICTGYRPFGCENDTIRDIIRRYDAEICNVPYDKRQQFLLQMEDEIEKELFK